MAHSTGLTPLSYISNSWPQKQPNPGSTPAGWPWILSHNGNLATTLILFPVDYWVYLLQQIQKMSNDSTCINWTLHKNRNMISSFSHIWIDIVKLSHCIDCRGPCYLIMFLSLKTYPWLTYQLKVKLNTPICILFFHFFGKSVN